MKVKITKTHETVEEVDISFPYYYEYELAADWSCHIYGKIDEKEHTQIKLDEHWRHVANVEFTIYKTKWSDCSCYLKEGYKSTKEEFLAAKAEALEILSRA
jgi:hypothetical protein